MYEPATLLNQKTKKGGGIDRFGMEARVSFNPPTNVIALPGSQMMAASGIPQEA
jgi:hypothetical protein